MVHPVKIIVHRVIHAVRPGERQAAPWGPQKIQKHGVVRAAANARIGQLRVPAAACWQIQLAFPRNSTRRKEFFRKERAASGSLPPASARANPPASPSKFLSGWHVRPRSDKPQPSASIRPHIARPTPWNRSARIPRRPSCKSPACAWDEYLAQQLAQARVISSIALCRWKDPPRQKPTRRDDCPAPPTRPAIRCPGCALP